MNELFLKIINMSISISAVLLPARGSYASPCVGFANYPFMNLPSGNTLRCKLFLFDKFHKIFLYFDDRIKYNEVKDKSGVVELTH